MRPCSIPTSAALLALLAACGPPKQPEEVALWTIDPVISLGVANGDSMREFGRVANALKLSNGRIAIADFAHTEVRVFNPNGSHALTVGRRGNGPGEFPALTRLAVLPGDTIAAGGVVRINKYTVDGNVVTDNQLDWRSVNRPPYTVEAAHPLAGGNYLLYMIRSGRGDPNSDAMHRTQNLWVVWRGSLEDSDTLGFFPGLEQINFVENNEHYTAIPHFPANTQHAISHNWLVIADLASDSVLRYDVKKGRGRWIHLPLVRQAITDSMLAEIESKGCSGAQDVQRCEIERRRVPRQSHYPEMADIAVDSAGNIWVRTNPPLVRGFAEWRVFDKDGIAMARLAIPASVRITQIGERYIMGITTDDLGVQRVVEYKLERHILEKWKGMRIVPREEYR